MVENGTRQPARPHPFLVPAAEAVRASTLDDHVRRRAERPLDGYPCGNPQRHGGSQHRHGDHRAAALQHDAAPHRQVDDQRVHGHRPRWRVIQRLSKKAITANQSLGLLSKSVSLVKFLALIAGAGYAAQGVSALSAGVTAPAARCPRWPGWRPWLATATGAAFQAKGVIALAKIDDVTTAVDGLNEKLDDRPPPSRRSPLRARSSPSSSTR